MNNSNKINWSFWSVVIIVLIVLVLGVVLLAKSPNNNKTIPVGDIMKIQADDHIKGPRDAEVVIIEYSDFQCPYCKIYSFHGPRLVDEFDGKVAVVFRHFPLESIHPNAKLAAQASEAADLQGKFWEMHDLIFERQEEWSESSDALGLFKGYAQDLGLDIDKFTVDIYSSAVKDRVSRDTNSAFEMNLDSTPTFFVNGVKINTPNSYDKFRQLIESNLSENK